jgi:hypothetical protein
MPFRYNASAEPLDVNIASPLIHLEKQASTTLAPQGGFDSARVEGYSYQQLISFDAGYSSVSGSERVLDDGRTTVHETLASAAVEGLNILNMVTADQVVARLTSQQPPATAPPHGQIRMLPTGSYFVNLRIAGTLLDQHLNLHPDLVVKHGSTKAAIEASCLGTQFHKLYDPGTGQPATPKEPLALSVFEFDPDAAPSIPGATVHPGWRIEIPDFGTIFLGELIATAGTRKLTMIRVVLSSAVRGETSAARVQGNGSTY